MTRGPKKSKKKTFTVKSGFVQKGDKTKIQGDKDLNSLLVDSMKDILQKHEPEEKLSGSLGKKQRKKVAHLATEKCEQAKVSPATDNSNPKQATGSDGVNQPKRKKKSSKKNKFTQNLSDVSNVEKSDDNPIKRRKQNRSNRNLVNTNAVIDVNDEYMKSWDSINKQEADKNKKPDKSGPDVSKDSVKTQGDKARTFNAWQRNEDFNATLKRFAADNLPDMSAWSNLFVPEPVLRALAENGFTSPTPIQALTLPSSIRDRKDIVGAAETGSGKTLSFGIPVIEHILRFKQDIKDRNALQTEENVTEEEDMSDEAEYESENLEEMSDLEPECPAEEDALDPDINTSSTETNLEMESEEGSVMEDSDSSSQNGEDDQSMQENKDGGYILDSKNVEFLEIPIGVDFDTATGSDEEIVEDDANLSPGEEDEENEMEEDDMGCVRVYNNVELPEVLSRDSRKSRAAREWVHDPARPLHCLILTPTRELAVQIQQHIDRASKHTDIQTCVVVGGMAVEKQIRILRRRPEIVIATPGRLWELIQEGAPHLSSVEDVNMLVIDEADRMVEKGHFQELSQLLDMINRNEEKKNARQSFVFSATLTLVHSGPTRTLSTKKQKRFKKLNEKDKLDMLMAAVGVKPKAKVVDLSRKEGTAECLIESRIMTSVEDKDLYIYYFLKQYPGRTLVFANSKDALRRLTSVLTLLKCRPLQLHADMRQKQRLKNLDKFTKNPTSLLLATDVAARGLDIPGVQHVIHFQVPRTSENYVHRSGRTARAQQEGLSVMLVSADDLMNYRKIIKTLNRNEELPVFPVEEEVLPNLRERVALARELDKAQHTIDKQRVQKSWFERAAAEADIELDNDESMFALVRETETSQEKAANQKRIRSLTSQLDQLLKKPVLQSSYVGKYPTQSGKLVIPYQTDTNTRLDAKNKVKASIRKDKELELEIKTDSSNAAAKRKKKQRNKSSKKKKAIEENVN